MTAESSLVADLPTPALLVDDAALRTNLHLMTAIRPGASLRPHVKAHKCTSLARVQAAAGHQGFTCATPREMIGMARAGLGTDLLLANECIDPRRLADLARQQDVAHITVAIDSAETIDAAARAGLKSVLVDVNVGLPRCGVDPSMAVPMAERALMARLEVRGVMGYEGHLMALTNDEDKTRRVQDAMATLVEAFTAIHQVAGAQCTVISAGGTGTCQLFDGDETTRRVTEVQAGSYALMDSHYGALGLPFRQALFVLGTVISSQLSWAVIDVGLKALGMDHGNPSIPGATVWFCSDEHTTFSVREGSQPRVGDKILVVPAHVDPTVSMHEVMFCVSAPHIEATVLDAWPIDLRGWSTTI